MANLFIFAVGGTGARVLRSLTILMASGLKVNADKIIPIIIDTDSQNHDTNRTLNLLNNYRDIRRNIPNIDNAFFANKIYSLSDLGNEQGKSIWGDSFILKLPDTSGKSFSEFINFSFIQDYETKSLINLLYSKQNLEDPLTYGFLGSPNVGSVVLDSINKTEEFKNFGNLFQPNDRIFIISSIFGGTGAAGFPLLVNNFRQFNPNLSNSNALMNSIIGAITVLPYFKLTKNENSRIDSSTFFTKAIASLSYYEENIKGINSLYYIGDASKQKSYDNIEGGDAQKNDANFIELASALAIYDFMDTPSENLLNNTLYKEFAIERDEDNLTFDALGRKLKEKLAKNLTSLYLFKVLRQPMEGFIGSTFMVNNNIYKDFFESNFYKDISKFLDEHFETYLTELNRNVRGFTPFGDVTPKNLSTLFNGKNIKLSLRDFSKECATIKSDKSNNKEKYIDMIYQASEKLFKEKLSKTLN